MLHASTGALVFRGRHGWPMPQLGYGCQRTSSYAYSQPRPQLRSQLGNHRLTRASAAPAPATAATGGSAASDRIPLRSWISFQHPLQRHDQPLCRQDRRPSLANVLPRHPSLYPTGLASTVTDRQIHKNRPYFDPTCALHGRGPLAPGRNRPHRPDAGDHSLRMALQARHAYARARAHARRPASPLT